jgi:hypothetical protein
VNAEAFINKASFLVTNSQQEVLNLQYKVCYFGNLFFFAFEDQSLILLDIFLHFSRSAMQGFWI